MRVASRLGADVDGTVAMDESTSTTAPMAEGVVVPRRCTLDGFATEVSQTDGIGLADLDPNTTLLVRTQN